MLLSCFRRCDALDRYYPWRWRIPFNHRRRCYVPLRWFALLRLTLARLADRSYHRSFIPATSIFDFAFAAIPRSLSNLTLDGRRTRTSTVQCSAAIAKVTCESPLRLRGLPRSRRRRIQRQGARALNVPFSPFTLHSHSKCFAENISL